MPLHTCNPAFVHNEIIPCKFKRHNIQFYNIYLHICILFVNNIYLLYIHSFETNLTQFLILISAMYF